MHVEKRAISQCCYIAELLGVFFVQQLPEKAELNSNNDGLAGWMENN